ncbi:hypothetical protein FB466_2579 [Klugiella xanthotipulae]|uniref:Uncharacterized protein n=2 Tax=Klugiella xanthotipulae TaxID=244735 RepID=A0A543HGY1_9MICO|nr:hypothetical protein FB466_2579 [Klugiella xanthotipulae]
MPYPQPPLRTLVLHSRKLPAILTPWVVPVVLLDGQQFPLGWGTQRYTIPADRPVHVQCEMPFIIRYGKAAVVLTPGSEPAQLEYSAPASQWTRGQLGAPGTTKTTGIGFNVVALTFVGLLFLGVIGLTVFG